MTFVTFVMNDHADTFQQCLKLSIIKSTDNRFLSKKQFNKFTKYRPELSIVVNSIDLDLTT